MTSETRQLLITDLDNTLWDWVGIWNAAYSVLIRDLAEASGVPRAQLEREIRTIHQAHGTSEYSNLVDEIPSIVKAASPEVPHVRYSKVLHNFRSQRLRNTVLYPGVGETLLDLRAQGVCIVAYTESQAYWSAWRIKRTGLDGIIDTLYSASDHTMPAGKPAGEPLLQITEHHHTPDGALKPSPEILASILEDQHVPAESAVYVGDNLMKDVAMARSVGVFDVHAKYGESHTRQEYELLRRVTHWSDADVRRERDVATCVDSPQPSLVCDVDFAQVKRAVLP